MVNIICSITERDPILHTVYCLTLNSWPEKFHEVPCIACQYWGTREETNGRKLITDQREQNTYTPELYQKMLHDLHEGHKGVEKMQHFAQEKIYWQGMDADIPE